MRGWNLALDAMTTLSHAHRTREMTDYLEDYAQDKARTQISLGVAEHDAIQATASVTAATAAIVERAVPVWVNSDVLTLVEAAAESGRHGETHKNGEPLKPFDPQPVHLDDLFEPNAFCLLERPLTLIDRWGKRVTYRAMGWMLATATGPAGSGPRMIEWDGTNPGNLSIIFAQWAHRDDGDDYVKPGEFRMIGGSPLYLVHALPIPFGDDWAHADPPTLELMRQAQILWQLAKQPIVTPEREPVDRATRKRAAKAGKVVSDVTVLRLRKVSPHRPKDGEEPGPGYSHRFPVAGHWRDQHYATKGDAYIEGVRNPASHRQIWIESYVKGDPELPLVVKNRVVEFVR